MNHTLRTGKISKARRKASGCGCTPVEENLSYRLTIGNVRLDFAKEASVRPRGRAYHSILDPPWSCCFDIETLDGAMAQFCPGFKLTPVYIAGKAELPDEDALRLARQVLTSPSAALLPLVDQIGIEFGPDNWMLSSIWFPYQTYRPCWFAEFHTEYDGQFEFGFRPDDEQVSLVKVDVINHFADAANEAGFCQDSFTSIPGTVSWVIDELVGYRIASDRFEKILRRIINERLFGTELVEPLILVLGESFSQVSHERRSHLEFLQTRLKRCRIAM